MKVALYGKNSESLEKILLGKGVTVVDRHREDFETVPCSVPSSPIHSV